MPERMQLVAAAAGTGTTTFSALVNRLNQPQFFDREEFISLDGTRYVYDFGSSDRHLVGINDVTKADATQFNTWWAGNTILNFTPDLTGAPSTTIHVRIGNETEPEQMMFGTGWDAKREGTLILEQVSSSSSSSSSAAP